MTRFTLHAPAFADPGIEQPGEILTLGWAGDAEELVLPQLGWRFPDGKPEQHWRNFTVRAFDPARATIDVDFYLHGDLGRASAWGSRAQPGDLVGYAGPRTHWEPDPAAEWVLLAADETGLPALLAILETLPAGLPVFAFAEVEDEGERQAVAERGRRRPALGLARAAARGHDVGADRGGAGARAAARAGRRCGAAARRSPCATSAATSRPSAPRATMNVMGYWKHRGTPDDVDY